MKRCLALLVLLFASFTVTAAERAIVVASKHFNENYVLAEIMAELLEGHGYKVDRRYNLGGTLICFKALQGGEIDVYPEYTGTIGQAILKIDDPAPGEAKLNRLLSPYGVSVLPSFGFNNTYAIAMKQTLAKKLGVRNVSDLARHPELKMAFSHEFMDRKDGWPGLSRVYGLKGHPEGIEHGLAYQAIHQGKIDVTDAYSTDADIARYHLASLTDDKHYFPQYYALPIVSDDMPAGAKRVLSLLAGRIDEDKMRELNAEVVVHGKTFAQVASQFLTEEGLVKSGGGGSRLWHSIAINTVRHLKLTAIALVLGCLIGLPLGVLVFRSPGISRLVVYIAGLMQTIPSIALLALMIPLFGIGQVPAIIALFLYSILPILRNTITALITIDPLLKRISEAIGLTRIQQLRYVLIPMAMPTVLAGVKTAAIISIGTATLAAFIGAGGLGEPIVTGLALNNTNLILQGAIPAACLAIIAELMFEGLERLIVKPHMRAATLPE
ncbi:MAG TPA: glycine betaine ABC transporter substrate-binding protein [Pseudomonadales bacterium]|nr:glycine betaine ABC transporter substrate-binding protein [Pseudomonadales bacterium]